MAAQSHVAAAALIQSAKEVPHGSNLKSLEWPVRSCKSLLGLGVLGSLVWGVALAFVKPGTAIAMLAVLAFFAYIVAVHVGIWRAAAQYEGAKVWAGLAKAAVLLTPACLIVGVLAAVIIPATNKPTQAVSQPAPQRLTDTAPTIAPAKNPFTDPDYGKDLLPKQQ